MNLLKKNFLKPFFLQDRRTEEEERSLSMEQAPAMQCLEARRSRSREVP